VVAASGIFPIPFEVSLSYRDAMSPKLPGDGPRPNRFGDDRERPDGVGQRREERAERRDAGDEPADDITDVPPTLVSESVGGRAGEFVGKVLDDVGGFVDKVLDDVTGSVGRAMGGTREVGETIAGSTNPWASGGSSGGNDDNDDNDDNDKGDNGESVGDGDHISEWNLEFSTDADATGTPVPEGIDDWEVPSGAGVGRVESFGGVDVGGVGQMALDAPDHDDIAFG
jgi:hypothetical protein